MPSHRFTYRTGPRVSREGESHFACWWQCSCGHSDETYHGTAADALAAARRHHKTHVHIGRGGSAITAALTGRI